MGRHGGINILHQKSWHVWRLDNRLTVERDELRHAEEERQKKTVAEQAVFSAKLKKLRQKADLGDAAVEDIATGLTGHPASSSSSKPQYANEQVQTSTPSKEAASFKYGMVTTSNLKQAEKHLDSILGESVKGHSKGKGKTTGKGKAVEVARKDCSLGSGPHINFFEETELEQKRHLEEHHKQLGYTQRNNELVGKSKKALFSEFDEIASDVPWYMRSSQFIYRDSGNEDERVSSARLDSNLNLTKEIYLRERSRSRSGLRRKWTEGHGQRILCVKPRQSQANLDHAPKDEDDALDAIEQEETRVIEKSKKDKKSKTDKKELKKDKKDKKKERERNELLMLRKMREDREARERARASSIISVRPECI